MVNLHWLYLKRSISSALKSLQILDNRFDLSRHAGGVTVHYGFDAWHKGSISLVELCAVPSEQVHLQVDSQRKLYDPHKQTSTFLEECTVAWCRHACSWS